jgi:sterol desaturase/sphingolipid hydroxylase (fatty acid hydroxylase superfamily)
MAWWHSLVAFFGNDNPLTFWIILFVVSGLALTLFRSFFAARKIQPRGFKWKMFRQEAFFGIINVAISGAAIGFTTKYLQSHGIITSIAEPTSWWVMALEYAAYFVGFDTWFYWLHRAMHREPVYKTIHKLHHLSTSTNLMTTISVNPLESLINGGFVPLFLSLVTVHHETMPLITMTNILMGLYVHCGYEFFPRWWNKSWATKWFITATFHDQHHRYFTYNFGGYTTVWDRLCGTIRPKFEADFEKLKVEQNRPKVAEAEAVGV